MPASDGGGDGGGHGAPGSDAAEVADVVDGGDAVLAQRAGHRGRASPQATASTVPASVRAAAEQLERVVMGAPSTTSARTQILSIVMCVLLSVPALDDLELLEELDDPQVALALVDDDLAGLAGLGRGDRR